MRGFLLFILGGVILFLAAATCQNSPLQLRKMAEKAGLKTTFTWRLPANPIKAAEEARGRVTVTLKNGNAITGKIVNRDAEGMTIRWEGGEIGVRHSEVASIEEGAPAKKKA